MRVVMAISGRANTLCPLWPASPDVAVRRKGYQHGRCKSVDCPLFYGFYTHVENVGKEHAAGACSGGEEASAVIEGEIVMNGECGRLVSATYMIEGTTVEMPLDPPPLPQQ